MLLQTQGGDFLKAVAAGWLYGFTLNFSAPASLRWLLSKARNSRTPKCNAVATWSKSKLRCPEVKTGKRQVRILQPSYHYCSFGMRKKRKIA
jgi:hypothetical protein